jgi:predicted metal-dependent phosphoesterase TrpH
MSYANFHTHTSFSDGAINPDDLVIKVLQERDLGYFALTDHDTLSGIEPVFRSLKKREHLVHTDEKRFVAGIELSLREERTGINVHLAGLFPNVNQNNYQEALKKIEAQLGKFCRYRSLKRGKRDLDGRIKRAFELNLDGLADRFQTAEEVIGILRRRAEAKNMALFKQAEKEQDVIQHPIPFTYQTIIDHWEDLVPNSTREIVTLYILRPGKQKAERLARIYQSQGMDGADARKLAETNQGTLCRIVNPPPSDTGIFEGLELLKKVKAVSVLVHPAIDHGKRSYENYDRNVLYPLMDQGLDGIEVFYPYDPSYREEAIDHYAKIARKHGLLISGGTDYHGDGRVGLSDVKLDQNEALRIINYNVRSG